MNRFRREHRIHVSGEDVPAPVAEFSEFADGRVCSRLLANVLALNYERPTPIQMQAIPIMLAVCN